MLKNRKKTKNKIIKSSNANTIFTPLSTRKEFSMRSANAPALKVNKPSERLQRNNQAKIKTQDQYNILKEKQRLLESQPQYRLLPDGRTVEEGERGVPVPREDFEETYRVLNKPGHDKMNAIADSDPSLYAKPKLDRFDRQDARERKRTLKERSKTFSLGGIDEDITQPTNNSGGGFGNVLNGITGIAGVGMQVYGALKAKQAQANNESYMNNLKDQQDYQTDKNFLKDYNTTGNETSFYKNGGRHKFNARKGLIPMGDNTFIVKGNKHSNGGVKIGDAEVEGEEVVKLEGNKMSVLSNASKKFGYSPAKEMIKRDANGEDEGKVFDEELAKQESMKKGNNKGRKFALGDKDVPIDYSAYPELEGFINNYPEGPEEGFKVAAGAINYYGKYGNTPNSPKNTSTPDYLIDNFSTPFMKDGKAISYSDISSLLPGNSNNYPNANTNVKTNTANTYKANASAKAYADNPKNISTKWNPLTSKSVNSIPNKANDFTLASKSSNTTNNTTDNGWYNAVNNNNTDGPRATTSNRPRFIDYQNQTLNPNINNKMKSDFSSLDAPKVDDNLIQPRIDNSLDPRGRGNALAIVPNKTPSGTAYRRARREARPINRELKQEGINEGIANMNNGNLSTISKTSHVGDFLDNAGNLAATLLTPKTSKPILDKNIQLHTDINTDPQLQQIKNAERSKLRFIKGNTSDSNVAQGLSQSAINSSSTARNAVRSNEINAENQLKNQEITTNAQISSGNNAKIGNYLERDAARSTGMIESLSENVANLGDDLTNIQNNKKYDANRKQSLMYEMMSQENPDVMKNAIALDPNSYTDIISDNYEALTGPNSQLSPAVQQVITSNPAFKAAYEAKKAKLYKSQNSKFRNFIK